MKAITELKNEHQGIKLMLNIMLAISKMIEDGKPVPVEHLEKIVDFLAVFADKCHHGKEEGILFPALASLKNQAMATSKGEILHEHQQARDLIQSAGKILQAHPKPGKDGLMKIAKIFREYNKLLLAHIETENTSLFPALQADINPGLDEKLFEAFETLEVEVIGLGKHEEYHAMLDKYEEIYLGK